MGVVFYRCKWCGKEFSDKDEAQKHAVICGMEFEIFPKQAVTNEVELF